MQQSSHAAPLRNDVQELKRSLTRATHQLSEIYRTTASKARLLNPGDARRIHYPGGASSRKLSAELARFDQLCDRMEIILAKAIINTRRAIQREEDRLSTLHRVASPESISPPLADWPDEPMPAAPLMQDHESVKVPDPAPASHAVGSAPLDPRLRRPSTITLSSLKGPRNDAPFPLKLDLSAASLGLDDGIIPGLFSPGTLATATGLPPHTGLEATSVFGEQLPVDLSQQDAAFAADGMNVDLTNDDNQDLAVTHSDPAHLHLDQNMDNLLTALASSKGSDKEMFSADVHDTKGSNQLNLAAGDHIAGQAEGDRHIGVDELALGDEYADFDDLSPSMFGQLDTSTSHFEEFKVEADLDLQSMAELFGEGIDSNSNTHGE